MKTKILFISLLGCSMPAFSQEIHFNYDEAGNQRYRGINQTGKAAPKSDVLAASVMDQKDKEFLEEIRIYPVPVKDVLTIDWSDKVDGLIDSVSLYQHSTLSWIFQQKNMPSLNRQLNINMATLYKGIYILRFTLTDSRVVAVNIIKE